MPFSEERFKELVGEALDGLPAWVLESLDNIEVFVEDSPPVDTPTLLGLYRGVPLSNRGSGYSGVVPDHITVYREPIERLARGNEERLRQLVARTVAHEIAHHFGISDERLRELGSY